LLACFLPSLFSSRGYWSIIREERKRARREGEKEPERQKRVALLGCWIHFSEGSCGCGIIEKRGVRKKGRNEGGHDGSWKEGASDGAGEQGREKRKEGG